MGDLIDRLSGESAEEGRPKIQIEQFLAGYVLYALGLKTKQEVAGAWGLQGQEVTQANALADALDAEVGASAKLIYLDRIRAISALIELGGDTLYHLPDNSVDKASVVADMGF